MNDLHASKELGAAIRDARLERGLTQTELAHRAGVSRSWLSGLERGVRPRAMPSKIEAVLDVLGLGEAGAGRDVELLRAPAIKGWKPPVFSALEQVRKMNAPFKAPIVSGLEQYMKAIKRMQLPNTTGLEQAQRAHMQLAKDQAPSLRATQIAAERLTKPYHPALQELNNSNRLIAESLRPFFASPRMQVPVVRLPATAFQGLPAPTLDVLRRITEMRLPAVSTNAVTRAAIEAIRDASRWDPDDLADNEGDVSAVLRRRNAHLQALIDDDAFPDAPFRAPAAAGAADSGAEES